MKRSIIFLMLIFPVFVSSQNTMYFMDRMPQNVYFNPAFIPNVKFYLGFPGMSGASANLYNSGFNYNEITSFIDNLKNSNYNPDEFVRAIGPSNQFNSEIKANIFAMGIKLKDKGYFSLGLSMNSFLSVKAKSEIAYLLADYNNISINDFPISIDDVDFLTNNFLNLNLTYSRKLNEHLTIGISPNINFNLIGAKASQMSYILDIVDSQSEFKEFHETISGELVVGLPQKINPDAISNGKLDLDKNLLPDNWENDLSPSDLLKNKSLSLNLGATYELQKWTFSASILNIGTTSWQNNAYHLDGNNDLINITNLDKLSIDIPTKIFIGVNRQFSPKWNYGLVYNNTSSVWGSNSSATISLNGAIGSMLSTSLSYTAGYTFDNLGLGFRLRFLPDTDLFFVTDNILQAIDYRHAKQFSGAFGINISFGVKKPKTDIPDEKEPI